MLCMTAHNRLHLQRYWQRSSTIEKLTFVQYIFIFVIWIYDQYILRTYETFSEKSNKILVSWKWQRVFFFFNEARRSWKRPYSISLCVYVSDITRKLRSEWYILSAAQERASLIRVFWSKLIRISYSASWKLSNVKLGA